MLTIAAEEVAESAKEAAGIGKEKVGFVQGLVKLVVACLQTITYGYAR